MKAWIIILMLAVAVAFASGATKTPINNGILQSDLDAAHYKILLANLADYAGTGLTWNVATNKFDATGGGGGGTGTPGGSNQQYQYNNAGAFGGISSVTYDGTIPLTISKDGGSNTRFTGIKLTNPNNATLNGEGKQSPAIHLIENVKSGGVVHTYDHMIWGESGVLMFGTSTDGSVVGGTGHAIVGFDSAGNIIPANGDQLLQMAVLQGLDWIETGGDASHPARVAMLNFGTAGISGLMMSSGSVVQWDTGGTWTNVESDTLLRKSAAGVVKVKNALELTPVAVSALPTGSLGRMAVVNDGAASLAWGATVTGGGSTKYKVWHNGTNWTVAEGSTVGGGGGTPGGSNTQVQFNNSGAFGGISGATTNGTAMTLKGPIVADNDSINYLTLSNTSGTSFTNQIQWQSAAGFNRWAMGNDSSRGGSLDFYLYDYSSASKLYINGNQFNIPAASILGWGTTASVDITGVDTGLGRNAAGVVEINNGTAGTFRDLKARNISATALNNLTTNGFVKTSGSVGTLSVDTSTYLTSANVDDTIYGAGWNGVTTIAPSKNAVYDQMELLYPKTGGVLTGNATVTAASASLILNPTSVGSIIEMRGTQNTQDGLKLSATATLGLINADSLVIKNRANSVTYGTFSSTALDLTNGITIGAAAASGKILIGNGTRYGASTPTWPNAAGAVGYLIRSDGTNFTSYPNQQTNSSTTNLTPSTSDIYLAGSSCVVTVGDFKAGGQYRCVFDMAKSAGTGSIVITLRIGTAGTTSDAAIQTFTFGAGTSVADTGVFDVVVNWRSVGSGTSAVVQGICRGLHNVSGGTTGLFNNGAGFLIIGSPSPSSGFNSSTATTIGLSFNGSTAFSGTNTLVQAQLQQ